MPRAANRRSAFFTAVEAYNRAHPAAPLPRPAARLLAVMFAETDVCSLSQHALALEGFHRKSLPKALHALVEAGFVSKQAGAATPGRRGTSPDTYRLRLEDRP
jgi:hypothetical protein